MIWADLAPLVIPERLIWDQLVDDLGPLYDPVVTDYAVLHSQGTIAAAAGLPC